MPVLDEIALHSPIVRIGGVGIALRTSSLPFAEMVQDRYPGFMAPDTVPKFSFDVEVMDQAENRIYAPSSPRLVPDAQDGGVDDDLEVFCESGIWQIRRPDFAAHWDPRTARGQIRQTVNPYSLDSILRILHSLILAGRGEFLVHAASAIRNGRAFLFSGVSGAGKTTISRLAPPDATLLTDEISYVRKDEMHGGVASYRAHGTPFAGELARLGENCSAPLHTLYMLTQGPENRIDDIHPVVATQMLLRNILFFARDAELVQCVFEAACRFVERVPVRRLTFRPDAEVWDWIG